jgi:EmrB/QacA subfamily drug resistance transporter
VPTQVGKQTALVVSCLASFLTPFMGSALNVALPRIASDFAMSAVALSWVPTSYLLASSVLLVPFGRLADIVGRRRVFLIGIILYTVSSLCCAVAPSAELLIVARILQGISAAFMFGMSIAILTSVFPPNERGKALGINSAAVYIGLSIGPFAGGVLTEQLGWRWVFWVNVPLGILMIILVLAKLREQPPESRGALFDIKGSILYCLALTSLMYGFSLLPDATGAGMVACGVAGLLLFIRLELRTESPVMDVRLFRQNKAFAFSNLAAFINYSATFAVTFLLSLYLSYIRNLTPQQAGAILVVQPVMMAIFSPLAGRVSDRIEPRVVASIGMAVIVIGLAFLACLEPTTPFWGIACALALLGFGFGLFSSPNTNAVMSSVEKRTYGVAAGTLATMRMTGQTISLGIAMIIFALVIGKVQITPEYHPQFLQSVRIAFGVFAVMCVVGVFSSLARGNVRHGKEF